MNINEFMISFEGDGNVLKLDCGNGCTIINLQKITLLKMSEFHGT